MKFDRIHGKLFQIWIDSVALLNSAARDMKYDRVGVRVKEWQKFQLTKGKISRPGAYKYSQPGSEPKSHSGWVRKENENVSR